MDDIPVTEVVGVPYEHEKPFVTKEQIRLGTQMFKFHNWYLLKSKEEMKMFGVKYRDQDFFRGKDHFCMDFELMHEIYRQDALDISILNI